jgi:hypothetical protein
VSSSRSRASRGWTARNPAGTGAGYWRRAARRWSRRCRSAAPRRPARRRRSDAPPRRPPRGRARPPPLRASGPTPSPRGRTAPPPRPFAAPADPRARRAPSRVARGCRRSRWRHRSRPERAAPARGRWWGRCRRRRPPPAARPDRRPASRCGSPRGWPPSSPGRCPSATRAAAKRRAASPQPRHVSVSSRAAPPAARVRSAGRSP